MEFIKKMNEGSLHCRDKYESIVLSDRFNLTETLVMLLEIVCMKDSSFYAIENNKVNMA